MRESFNELMVIVVQRIAPRCMVTVIGSRTYSVPELLIFDSNVAVGDGKEKG